MWSPFLIMKIRPKDLPDLPPISNEKPALSAKVKWFKSTSDQMKSQCEIISDVNLRSKQNSDT